MMQYIIIILPSLSRHMLIFPKYIAITTHTYNLSKFLPGLLLHFPTKDYKINKGHPWIRTTIRRQKG